MVPFSYYPAVFDNNCTDKRIRISPACSFLSQFNSRDEENELKNAGYHAEKQGDDGEATIEELGTEDDDFDYDSLDDDYDDYGDGNIEE